MSDDFILKWDSATQQLVGEDPDGNPVAIPLSAVEIDDSATVDGETVAIDGDPQPPETHGNEAHTETFLTEDDVGGVPSGVITMWSGSSSDVPDGWVLCDGNNGTPDLRNRFTVGAGDQYSSGDTGGAAEVQLEVSEMPSHDHSYIYEEEDGDSTGTNLGTEIEETVETTNTTSTSGGDQPHENRPPYYALAYIMKE